MDNAYRAQGARDMTRDALLADKTPDLSRFSVEELTEALIGAERELKNAQGDNWPPLVQFQRTMSGPAPTPWPGAAPNKANEVIGPSGRTR